MALLCGTEGGGRDVELRGTLGYMIMIMKSLLPSRGFFSSPKSVHKSADYRVCERFHYSMILSKENFIMYSNN